MPFKGYVRDPKLRVAVTSACTVGANFKVNDAVPPGASDEGQLVNGPNEYGDCEKTLETIDGVGTTSVEAVLLVTVNVADFVAPILT